MQFSVVCRGRAEAANTIRSFTPLFGVPVVLMAQDGRGRPTFYGRTDIARFMSWVPLRAIPCDPFQYIEINRQIHQEFFRIAANEALSALYEQLLVRST